MLTTSLIKKRYNREKRKKGQTIIDWFFYRRFLDVLPKECLIIYYANIALYFLFLIAMIVLYAIGMGSLGGKVMYAYFVLAAVPLLFMYHRTKNK